MAQFSLTLDGKFSSVWRLPCMPGTLCHLTSMALAASCRVGTIVSNDLLSVRAWGPVTRFSMRLSTRAGSPVGGDPISTTACFAGPEFARVASTTKACTKPDTQGAVRLKAEPTPCQLRGHPAHMPVARFGDPLFPRTLTALIRRRREAR